MLFFRGLLTIFCYTRCWQEPV